MDSNGLTFLLGTGPSLPDWDWTEAPPGSHLCAINGAGLAVPGINSMVFCDRVRRLMEDYGDPIKAPLADEGIQKITHDRSGAVAPGWVKPVQYITRLEGQAADKDAMDRKRDAIDGRLPLFCLDGLSCTFALLWLIHSGHRDIIFVGHDMMPGKTAVHFYDLGEDGQRLSVSLEHQFRTILDVWSLTRKRGITLRAKAPSRLLDFMPTWEPSDATGQPA